MSLQQRARDLVRMYDHILEQQIVGRGYSLACKDEKLWKQVEDHLKDVDAQEVHCLGLDTLREMEESLKAAAASAPPGSYSRRVRTRGGLRGLARAFEVMEQAALNLYLGPWRKEYSVIKMYSGTFTHYISSVLSMPQIESLFGLLGYQHNSFRPEELCLRESKVRPASLDDLLRLSCAFFVARCECQLLLSALGNHVGDAQWELHMVWERQRGNSLQVAFENVKKQLDVSEPLMELPEGEVDLYRGEHVNEEPEEGVDEENPHSVIRAVQGNKTSPAGQRRSNGASFTSSSPESDTRKSFSANKSKSKRSSEELKSDQLDSLQIHVSGFGKAEPDVNRHCSCLSRPPLILKHCFDCNALHDVTCCFLGDCTMKGHKVQFADELPEKKEMSPLSGNGTNDPTCSNAAGTPDVCDDAKSAALEPISYHVCCDLRVANPDPRILCHKCRAFHSSKCVEGKLCGVNHKVSELGRCSCGKRCARKPLVLCRYCGREYCSACWYRRPLSCICGQTFDQESSV
ncbi:spermatogenesis associated 2-like [Austrofundulus limnaeus]|uniref:Spermatogenesis associated 2-like n=1 Tax=Austrofundulus limnaeus TaxID=52670 RepID=A0A2I4DAP5_AUSLI|nr:PREDICTED: spermatogenesis-associated protein 2-like protein [Austrofundulus limnaeus]